MRRREDVFAGPAPEVEHQRDARDRRKDHDRHDLGAVLVQPQVHIGVAAEQVDRKRGQTEDEREWAGEAQERKGSQQYAQVRNSGIVEASLRVSTWKGCVMM